jgi:hypothetical protein
VPDLPELSGTVEIDGTYAGGNVKPANKKTERLRAVFPLHEIVDRAVLSLKRCGSPFPGAVCQFSAELPWRGPGLGPRRTRR